MPSDVVALGVGKQNLEPDWELPRSDSSPASLGFADLNVIIAVTLSRLEMKAARGGKDVALPNAERVRERGNPRCLIPVIFFPTPAHRRASRGRHTQPVSHDSRLRRAHS